MLNITDLKKEQQLPHLLRLGFRPFFLLGGLFSLVAMIMWLLSLNGVIGFSPLNGIVWWHSHEMLFGFVPAIIGGFLLTAVQTWTGIASVKGYKLLFLVSLWLSARLLIMFNIGWPFWLTMCVDLTFLPMVGLFLAIPLVKAGQQRNLVFLPILLLMTLANLFSYLPQFTFSAELATQGLHAMVMLCTLLVALLGGRVVPMFTANGTKTEKVLPLKWLEMLALFSLLLIFIFFITGLSEYSVFFGVLLALSALLHLYRIIRWRPWITLTVPLVWVLHFSMMFIPIGLSLLSMHFLFGIISLSAALHSFTVGVIGGMILAMMSRVSLGHTGRPLKVSALMVLAFLAIIWAALIRSILLGFLPQYSVQLWLVSGLCWCIAYACFVWTYYPILSQARIDGRPG